MKVDVRHATRLTFRDGRLLLVRQAFRRNSQSSSQVWADLSTRTLQFLNDATGYSRCLQMQELVEHKQQMYLRQRAETRRMKAEFEQAMMDRSKAQSDLIALLLNNTQAAFKAVDHAQTGAQLSMITSDAYQSSNEQDNTTTRLASTISETLSRVLPGNLQSPLSSATAPDSVSTTRTSLNNPSIATELEWLQSQERKLRREEQHRAKMYRECEEIEDRSFGELMRAVQNQYHEEQLWKDKINTLSSYGTFALLFINSALFLSSVFIVEPMKRSKMLRTLETSIHAKQERILDEANEKFDLTKQVVASKLDEFEQSIQTTVERTMNEALGRRLQILPDKSNHSNLIDVVSKPNGNEMQKGAHDPVIQKQDWQQLADRPVVVMASSAVLGFLIGSAIVMWFK